MTIKQQKNSAYSHMETWKKSTYTSLHDAYKRPSPAKEHAFAYCERLRDSLQGHDLKVITHNCMMFTAGFEYVDSNTGVLMFMYITPSYDIEIEMR